jgi:hypothetical protein
VRIFEQIRQLGLTIAEFQRLFPRGIAFQTLKKIDEGDPTVKPIKLDMVKGKLAELWALERLKKQAVG